MHVCCGRLEIWIRAYKGDHVGQTAAQAAVASAASVAAFVLGPIVGGLSDAHGRKPMMLMACVLSTIMSALITWRPTVPVLLARQLLMSLSNE
jgi:MFS family permease